MKRIASLALAMGLMAGCESGAPAPATGGGPQVNPAEAAAAQEAMDAAEKKAGEAASAAKEAAGDAAAEAAKPNP